MSARSTRPAGLNGTRRGAREGHCSSDVPAVRTCLLDALRQLCPGGARPLSADKLIWGCRDTTGNLSRDKCALVSYWVILSWKPDLGPHLVTNETCSDGQSAGAAVMSVGGGGHVATVKGSDPRGALLSGVLTSAHCGEGAESHWDTNASAHALTRRGKCHC